MGLLDTKQDFLVRATEGPIPKFVSIGIRPHDPEVIIAEVGAGLVTVGARGRTGIGKAAENEPAIDRLFETT